MGRSGVPIGGPKGCVPVQNRSALEVGLDGTQPYTAFLANLFNYPPELCRSTWGRIYDPSLYF